MSANKLQIDSYTKDIAAAGTPENLVADSGDQWRYAREVVLKPASGNTSPLLVGNRTRQGYSLSVLTDGVEEIKLSTILNRMSQSGRYDLREIFVKAGTNGDDVEILLIEPSMD